MKIGLLAYSSNTGLGYQTLDFYKNMSPEKVLLVDLSKFNGMETHHDRYYRPRITDGFPTDEDCEWLTDGVDIIFVCETPLNFKLFEIARRKGVKSVLQYNYEFLNYFKDRSLPAPDIFASPSLWEMEKVKELGLGKVVYLPVPVDLEKIPFRSFEKAETFVHILGRPAAHDRNGAIEYLEAIKTLPEYYRSKIFYQTPVEQNTKKIFEPIERKLEEVKSLLGERLEIVVDCKDNREMYKNGEILVLPRKYGGLCLPLWEALSAGMPTIMTDIDPNNKILPKEWLVESYLSGEIYTHSAIPFYSPRVPDLVSAMLRVSKNIKEHNIIARKLAINFSWELQKSRYLTLFEQVIKYGHNFIF